MKQFLPFLLLFFVSGAALAQGRVIEGKVTDSSDGTGIPGVNVVVAGSTKGTATDLDGHYRIELTENENSLTFSFLGYETVTREVGQQTTLDVALAPQTETLDEVVVVAYGTQKKSDLTGSVATLRGGDLTKIPSLDPTMALQGKVAGVLVTNSSGAPGSQPIVRIRGTGTFGDASVVYVVDGVITQDISFLNSSDISSMEVLKDASATALYGSRGANGVILITTKQGGKTAGSSAPVLSFSADYSVQDQSKRIALLNGREYADAVNQFLVPKPYNNLDKVANTDWQKEIFRAPAHAPIQNYQFSASGSSEKVQYYIGVGYFKQDGIIDRSNYERLTVRLNNTYQISKKIRLGNNITLAPYRQQNTSGRVVSDAYHATPTITPYDLTGNYSSVPGIGNPLADINYTNSFAKGLRTVGNVFAEVDILKGLTARSTFGVDLLNSKSYSFTPDFEVDIYQRNSPNTLDKAWGNRSSWLWENTLTYNKEVGKHRFNVLGGYTMQDISSENVALQSRGIIRPGQDFWYITPQTLRPTANADIDAVDPNQNFSMMSLLGRANYTYDNRFLFTATIRRDGSSKFIQSNRWGNFPSLAVGWNIINEQFMKQVTALSNLKVRASWGTLGNEKIDYLRQYSPTIASSAVFGTTLVPGLTYGPSGNKNLTWETTHQIDAGLEIGLLNDKLTLEADYYRRDTKDILVQLATLAYQGNGQGSKTTYNAAEVINKGIEVTIGWKGQISTDWSYRINGNVTTVKNYAVTVNGVGGNDNYLDGTQGGTLLTRTVPGKPIGSFYMYKAIGVYQSADDVAGSAHFDGAVAGDVKYADTNKDGVLNSDDKVNLGSPIPTLLYGLSLGTTYKGFELSVDVTGVSGNKIFNEKEQDRPNLYNFEKHAADYWGASRPSNSEPRPTTGGNNWLPSSRFIQNGSYVRLRSVSLSYTVPKTALDNIHLKSARVFVRGTNLFTKSKFTGYTPEIASSDPTLTGIDGGTYPLPAVYTAGFNLTF